MITTPRLARLAGRAAFLAASLPDRARLTDCHVHTSYTDGHCAIREVLEAARGRLEAIAFTEHVRRGCPWFGRFRAEVAREARAFPALTVWVGCEAKALGPDGGLDADPWLIAKCDLVLGAFHGYPDGRGGWLAPTALSAQAAARLELQASLGLLAHPEVDVLAHPGALTRRYFGDFPQDYLKVLVRRAAAAGKAIELNGEYMTLSELTALHAACREAGAWVTLGSNAHRATEVGRIGRKMEEVLAHAS